MITIVEFLQGNSVFDCESQKMANLMVYEKFDDYDNFRFLGLFICISFSPHIPFQNVSSQNLPL